MFNETSYFNDRTPECEAIKANCDTRFPVDPNNPLPSGIDLNWECMKTTGYASKCMQNTSYENPGSSTYWLDAATNPDNPGYILPDFGLGGLNTPAVLIALAAGAVFLLFVAGRR